jgi:dCTP deaminase
MILSDRTVRQLVAQGRIGIDPLPPDHHFQPATVDITLSDRFLFPRELRSLGGPRVAVVDTYLVPDDLMEEVSGRESVSLSPGQFVLASTVERLTLPHDIVARVEGRSSLGRLGLLIHSTAGFVDPGWRDGQITLELSNVAPWALVLHAGMRIGQIAFEHLDRPARRCYGDLGLRSRYQAQDGPTASRFSADIIATNGAL